MPDLPIRARRITMTDYLRPGELGFPWYDNDHCPRSEV